jgi:hypothetical protein
MHDGVARISGHEEHLQAWLAVLQFVRQLSAVHSGHHDVGQQQIDPERIGIE